MLLLLFFEYLQRNTENTEFIFIVHANGVAVIQEDKTLHIGNIDRKYVEVTRGKKFRGFLKFGKLS